MAAEGELAAVGQKVAEDGHVDGGVYLKAIPLVVIKDVTESPDVEIPKAETEEPGTKELDEEADESIELTTNSAADECEKIHAIIPGETEHLTSDNYVDSVVSFESFRALKLSNSERLRALKLSLFETFRAIEF